SGPSILDLMKLYPREAVAALAPSSIEFFTARQGVLPRALIEGMVAAADGDSARALAKYDEARARLEAELQKKPAHEFRYHIALGRALAGLRRNADALREARTGVELLPISNDAIDGPSVLEELAARVRRYRRYRCSDPRDRVLAFDARLSLTRAAAHRPEMAAAARRPAFPQVGRALALHTRLT